MGKSSKRKRESRAAEEMEATAGGGSSLATPASERRSEPISEIKEGKGVEVIYRLADGSQEWTKRLSRKKSLPDIISKVSKHLSLTWSPDVRLAHVRDGGREVEIWDEYDFRAFRDRAFDSAKKDPILVKVYPPGGPSSRRLPSPVTPSVVHPALRQPLPLANVETPAAGISPAKPKRRRKSKLLQTAAGVDEAEPPAAPGSPQVEVPEPHEIPKTGKKRKGKGKETGPEEGLDGAAEIERNAVESVVPQPVQAPLPEASTTSVQVTPAPTKSSKPPISALKAASTTKPKKPPKRVSLAVPEDLAPTNTSSLGITLLPETSSSNAQPQTKPSPVRAYSPSIPSELLQESSHTADVPSPAPAALPPAPLKKAKPTKKIVQAQGEVPLERLAEGNGKDPVDQELAQPADEQAAPKKKKQRPKKPLTPAAVPVQEDQSDPKAPPPLPSASVPEIAAIVPESPKPVAIKSKKRPRSPSPEQPPTTTAIVGDAPPVTSKPRKRKKKDAITAPIDEPPVVIDEAADQPTTSAPTIAPPETKPAKKKKTLIQHIQDPSESSVFTSPPSVPPFVQQPGIPPSTRIDLSTPCTWHERPLESNLQDSSAFSLSLNIEEIIAHRRRLKKKGPRSGVPWLPMPGLQQDKQGKLKFMEVEWSDSEDEGPEERVTEYGVVLVPGTGKGSSASTAPASSTKPVEGLEKQLSETALVPEADDAGVVADVESDNEDTATLAKKPAKPRKSKSKAALKAAAEEAARIELEKESPPPEDLDPNDPAQIPSSRFRPAPKSRFCIICFETPNHLQVNCPVVKTGLAALESTAVERRKLGRSKKKDDKEWSTQSLEAIEHWENTLRREEIRRRVTGQDEEQVSKRDPPAKILKAAAKTSKSATVAPPPVPLAKSPKTKKADIHETIKSTAPPISTTTSPEKARRVDGLHRSDSASSEERQVEEDVARSTVESPVSVSPVAAMSPVKSANRPEPALPFLPRPPSLLRLTTEGARGGSISGMSASSVAIESDSESEDESDGSAKGDESIGESDAEGPSDEQEDQDQGSSESEDEDIASGDDGSNVSSEDDEEEVTAPKPGIGPMDLLQHFLTAPLSKKDIRAAKKSAEQMRPAAAPEDETESEDEEPSDNGSSSKSSVMANNARKGRAASRESSIGDYEDGNAVNLGGDGASIEEVPSDHTDQEDNGAKGSRGANAPPVVSTTVDSLDPIQSFSNQVAAISPKRPFAIMTEDDPEDEPRGSEATDAEPEQLRTVEEASEPDEDTVDEPEEVDTSAEKDVLVPSSSLDVPSSALRASRSFSGRNRDADSISVNDLEGAVALEQAREEEALPEREAFESVPGEGEDSLAAPETMSGDSLLYGTQASGLAEQIVRELDQRDVATPVTPKRKNRKMSTQVTPVLKSTQKPNGLAPSPIIKPTASQGAEPELPSQSFKTASQSSRHSRKSSIASHVSDSHEAAPVSRRTRAASKEPSVPSQASAPPSQRTPRASQRSVQSNGDAVAHKSPSATTSTPRAKRAATKKSLASQEKDELESSQPAPAALDIPEEEVEYVSQEDAVPAKSQSTTSSPYVRRSSRQPSSVPPPASVPTSSQQAPVPESPASRKSNRARTSVTPSLPPSSPEAVRTPRAATRASATDTPLFITQSQPMATQAYKAYPSTPPSSVNKTPKGSTRSVARPSRSTVKVSSPIREEDDEAEDIDQTPSELAETPRSKRSKVNGHKANGHAEKEDSASPPASTVDEASTTFSSAFLPRAPPPAIKSRPRASLPSSSFQPLSSLDKDSLRAGFNRSAPLQIPSASAPVRANPRRGAPASDEEDSSEDESDSENGVDKNPELRGRYAGAKTRKRASTQQSNRKSMGW